MNSLTSTGNANVSAATEFKDKIESFISKEEVIAQNFIVKEETTIKGFFPKIIAKLKTLNKTRVLKVSAIIISVVFLLISFSSLTCSCSKKAANKAVTAYEKQQKELKDKELKKYKDVIDMLNSIDKTIK